MDSVNVLYMLPANPAAEAHTSRSMRPQVTPSLTLGHPKAWQLVATRLFQPTTRSMGSLTSLVMYTKGNVAFGAMLSWRVMALLSMPNTFSLANWGRSA